MSCPEGCTDNCSCERASANVETLNISSKPLATPVADGRRWTDRIERDFVYHRPEGEKVSVHDDIRASFKEWATALAGKLPEGREKSLAFTALEEASFWAHAAIAREGK